MANKTDLKTGTNSGTFHKYFGVPLTKTADPSDDGTATVRGFFTSDQKDEVGDIITQGATKRAIEKYRKWGNIRYMHLPKPVGKVTRIGVEDGLEWNEVEIKVIDPDAVFEVKNDLLTALSVGIFIKFDDIEFLDDGGWIINDYGLAEISLVDHPANYDAILTDVKGVIRQVARTQGRDRALCELNRIKEELRLVPEDKISDTNSDATKTELEVNKQDIRDEEDAPAVVEKGVIPFKDTGTADKGESWSKPDLGDFTSESFDELPDLEKRRIARHYTWSDNMPPETFGDLSLPHHKASQSDVGAAVWRGVTAAMARLNQTEGIDQEGCYNHLAKHYEQFDEEPPEKSAVFNGEYSAPVEEEKSPACRQDDETYDECVDRKTNEMIEEGDDPDEAYAAAHEICETPCSENALSFEEPENMDKELMSDETRVLEEEITDEEIEETEKLVDEADIEPLDEETDEDEVEKVVETEESVEEPEVEELETEELSEEKELEAEEVDEIEALREEVKELTVLVRALAEVPEDGEQAISKTEQEELERLSEEVERLEAENEELKSTIDDLRKELDDLRKPANRKGGVVNTELPEEIDEEEKGEKGNVEKSKDVPMNVHVRRFLESKNYIIRD